MKGSPEDEEPLDCVREVLSLDVLKELTENAGSWRVTVSQSGEIKDQGQKVAFLWLQQGLCGCLPGPYAKALNGRQLHS
jgi:hypothetical protein